MNSPADDPINILLLTTELRPGGAEKCLVNLACGLDRTKFRPTVVSIFQPPGQDQHKNRNEDKLVKQLEQCDVPTHFLNCHSLWSSWRAIKKLRQIVTENEIDTVQSFLVHANILAGLALRKLPEVRHFTGIRVADPSKMRHRLERWTTSNAVGMICVSESVKQFAIESMQLPKEKLFAIPNGVETPVVDVEFEPVDFEIRKPYVVFAGRLEPQKGLIKFFQEFQERENEVAPCELVFVGDGSEKSVLERLAKGLNRRCHFVGWQPNPHNFVAHAQALILPSIWEGMPNVLLEAMSLGKPLVAFGVDGVNELVGNDEIQICEPGNYRLFLERLSQLVGNTELAEKTGEQNRERVKNNFTIKKMIANYEAVYLGNPVPPG